MIFLEISKIGPEGTRFDHSLDLSALRDEEERPLVPKRVRLLGSAIPEGKAIELEARVEAMARLHCSRCLEAFDWPVATDFRLRILPEAAEAAEVAGGETRMDAGDADLFYATEGRASLEEIAREQIYLALPLKPVCSSDCAGLCPTCGANRNRLHCGCSQADLDPRLAPLLDLKQSLKGRKDHGQS